MVKRESQKLYQKRKPNPEAGRPCLPETEDGNKQPANSAKTESWKCYNKDLKPNLKAEQAYLPKTDDQ